MLPLRLFPKEFVCFRSRRLCSHLAHYCGRGLPATILQPQRNWVCPDFPPLTKVRGNHRVSSIMQYNSIFASYCVGSTTSSPITIACFSTKPALASTTNHAGSGEEKEVGNVSGDTFSSMCTISPPSAAQIISSA